MTVARLKARTSINPRLAWMLLYVAVNVVAYLYIRETGYLMGDGDGIPVRSGLLLSYSMFAIAASFFGVYLYFSVCQSLPATRFTLSVSAAWFSFFYMALLLTFIGYVAATGLFVAGSPERGGGAASAFFVIFNVDVLFFFYFALCRDSRIYPLVVTVFLLSVIQRGWFGSIFMVLSLESFRFLRHGSLRPWHIILLALLIVAYPVIDAVKVYVRLNNGFELSGFLTFVEAASQVVNVGIQDSLVIVFEQIAGRLQTVSHAYIVFDQLEYFDFLRGRDMIGSFWKEGIFGVIADALTQTDRLQEAPQSLALLIAPELESSWNVNPSLIGWISIYGQMAPLALSYVAILALISSTAMKVIANNENGRDVLWFLWLTMILPGWISQFATFLWTMLIFIALAFLMNGVGRFVFRAGPQGRRALPAQGELA